MKNGPCGGQCMVKIGIKSGENVGLCTDIGSSTKVDVDVLTT